MTNEPQRLREKILHSLREHPELPAQLKENTVREHMDMALNSKYPAVACKHALKILNAIHLADQIEEEVFGIKHDEIPKLAFKVELPKGEER